MGAENQPDVRAQYEAGHAELRSLLGKGYDERKIDAIAGTMGFDTTLEEARRIGALTDPAERQQSITNWYEEHREVTDMFGA